MAAAVLRSLTSWGSIDAKLFILHHFRYSSLEICQTWVLVTHQELKKKLTAWRNARWRRHVDVSLTIWQGDPFFLWLRELRVEEQQDRLTCKSHNPAHSAFSHPWPCVHKVGQRTHQHLGFSPRVEQPLEQMYLECRYLPGSQHHLLVSNFGCLYLLQWFSDSVSEQVVEVNVLTYVCA